MKTKLYYSLSIILFSICNLQNSLTAQKLAGDAFFESGNFEEALESYESEIESIENPKEVYYKMAVCILNLNMGKQDAINYLKKNLEYKDPDPNAKFLLARAYQYEFMFDDAIKMFYEFQKSGVGSYENLNACGRHIECCQNAKELMKFPVEVSFTNLGPNVNSPFADYFPFAAKDESFLFFNSRRNNAGEKASDGLYASDIYVSTVKNGEYTKAKTINKKYLSPNFDEEIVGLSSSNNKAVVYLKGKDGSDGKITLFDVKNNDLFNPKNLPEVIRTKYNVISASVNNESKEIYFASDQPGGYGGTDLYVIRLLPNGDWGEPQNLGPSINTIYDEDFPVLSDDGKILYFSSKGHSSFGGYDIFRAEYDQEKKKYLNPRNLGYPINSPYDEMNFSVSESGKYGYISTVRKGGLGDLDIYRISFNDIEPNYTVYYGTVSTEDKKAIESISIVVTDENGDIYGEYLPNLSTMRYVIILPPGKFTLSIESDGYAIHEEIIDVKDKSDFQYEVVKDIELKK